MKASVSGEGFNGYTIEMIFSDIFFFSSRRRHTRCSRDWSSDVCSSDLTPAYRERGAPDQPCAARLRREQRFCRCKRSEERRVGEEGRSRGSPFHLKKKKRILSAPSTHLTK